MTILDYIKEKEVQDQEEYLTLIQQSLLKILKEEGPKSRRELVKQLETPRTTIYDNLLKLQKRKKIEKHTKNNGKRGRPVILWRYKE